MNATYKFPYPEKFLETEQSETGGKLVSVNCADICGRLDYVTRPPLTHSSITQTTRWQANQLRKAIIARTLITFFTFSTSFTFPMSNYDDVCLNMSWSPYLTSNILG